MATVRSSLQLFDRFSHTMTRARQGMDTVIESAERLQQRLRLW